LQLHIVLAFLCYKVSIIWAVVTCYSELLFHAAIYNRIFYYIVSAFTYILYYVTYILLALVSYCHYALCCIIIILVFTVNIWSTFV